MEWLNYHHLLYFWIVAKEGSIVKASNVLSLAQPTISGQIHRFEEVLGEKLFVHKGRQLVMTEIGRVVFRYAEEIFSLGEELQSVLRGRPVHRPPKIIVGVTNAFPTFITRRLLEPALKLLGPVNLVCREDKPERLLAELAVHGLDVVLTDAPLDPTVRVKAFSHLLGECGVTFLGAAELAKKYKRGFPQSLDGAPVLLPASNTMLRQSLDEWLRSRDIIPRVIGEFEDSILFKTFGQSGVGMFPIPSVIADEVQRQFQVRPVGRMDDVRMRYYAISVEQKLKHPALIAISEEARKKLFNSHG